MIRKRLEVVIFKNETIIAFQLLIVNFCNNLIKIPKVFKKNVDIDSKSRIVVFENIRKELQLL